VQQDNLEKVLKFLLKLKKDKKNGLK